MGFMLWSRSRNKVVTGTAVALVAFIVVAFMPQAWEERMRTIQSYEMDTSAMGRINAWWTAYNLASHRFTGGGFEVDTPEIFARYAPDPSNIKVAHSIYFSVLGEHGFIGLLLFLSVWLMALYLSRSIRIAALSQAPPQWSGALALMCQTSLVGYAVGGAFLSLAYFDLPYNIVVILVVTMQWLKAQHGVRPSC
jgi:probable O-glycosylation ligase (exosortase A-associated)